MGLFFQKNKNTPYIMMLKFQKTKNKKTKVSKSKMNQLYSALENEIYYHYQKEPSKSTSK